MCSHCIVAVCYFDLSNIGFGNWTVVLNEAVPGRCFPFAFNLN